MTSEQSKLADEIDAAIAMTIRKRNSDDRVVNESVASRHRNMIVAALRAGAEPSDDEAVAWEFRQRSGIGKGPQSGHPWGDWCGIDRETYDRYVSQPNNLVEVRPLYTRASAEPSASVREEMVKLRDDCLHESKKTDRCYTCYTDQAAYIARRIDVILAGETWLQSQAAAALSATPSPLMQAAGKAERESVAYWMTENGYATEAMRSLLKIAHYSPGSTVQPVAIARDALIKLIGTWQQGCLDGAHPAPAESVRSCISLSEEFVAGKPDWRVIRAYPEQRTVLSCHGSDRKAAEAAYKAALSATPSPLMQAAGKAAETVPELTSDFAKALPGGTLDDSTYSAIEDALDAIDAPMTEGSRYMTLVERIMALRAAAGKAAPQASAESELRKALQAAYFELKKHDADYHYRTPVAVNSMIVDALYATPPGEKK